MRWAGTLRQCRDTEFWPDAEHISVPLEGSPNVLDKNSPLYNLEAEYQGPPLFSCNTRLEGRAAALLRRLETTGGKPSVDSL